MGDLDSYEPSLRRNLLNLANQMRGTMDGWDFRAYVLSLLFLKFLSDDFCQYVDEIMDGDPCLYRDMDDSQAEALRDEVIAERGFFIFPSQLFCNLPKTTGAAGGLCEKVAESFRAIGESCIGGPAEGVLSGLFKDVDFTSPRLGGNTPERDERIRVLLDGIGAFEFQDGSMHGKDMFGDAYERLLSMYASNAGKAGGEFFTPSELSELVAYLAVDGRNGHVGKVYDPACGTGSLLMKVAEIVGDEAEGYFGQEINATSYDLCRANMLLHHIPYEKSGIVLGDTLKNPGHWDVEPFDTIVSNPPFGLKWSGRDDPKLMNDPRFSAPGILAPPNRADYAFIMHMFSWLSEEGRMVLVEYPGVLYRHGAEEKIRRYLVDSNYVKTVIQLPVNLFFGSRIPTCIVVLEKNQDRDDILFVDASDMVGHVNNRNTLMPEHIRRIRSIVHNRRDESGIARLVDLDEVKTDKGRTLSVATWVGRKTDELPGLDELESRIRETVAEEVRLRDELDGLYERIPWHSV